MRCEVGRFVAILVMLSFGLGLSAASVGHAPAPSEVVRALGTKRGKSISAGLVFIDGKYIRAPYRVTRAGNQILINDCPVTGQLVSWEEFLKTQPPSKVKVTEVEESAAAPSAEPSVPQPSVEDGVDPAAPKDGGNVSPTARNGATPVRVVIEESLVGAGADELEDFKPDATDRMKLTDIPPDSEEDKARQKRAFEEKADEEEEAAPETPAAPAAAPSDDPVDPASPEGEAAAKAAAAAPKPAVKTRKVYSLEGAFDMNFRAQKLMKPIDAYRGKIETTLRRGGYIFFGTKYRSRGLQTTDASATKELLKKLPELLREANDSEGFCDAVRSAGLMNYMTYQIAQDLYRHKTDFAALMQRRRELAADQNLKTMMNR